MTGSVPGGAWKVGEEDGCARLSGDRWPGSLGLLLVMERKGGGERVCHPEGSPRVQARRLGADPSCSPRGREARSFSAMSVELLGPPHIPRHPGTV